MWNEQFRAANGAKACALPLKPLHLASQFVALTWLAVALVATFVSYRFGVTPFEYASDLAERAVNIDAPRGPATTLRTYFAQSRLPDQDALLYQHLFALAADGRWDAVDQAAQGLKSPQLMAWIKAQELTAPNHTPHIDELTAWLDRNEYLPQAAAVQKRLAALAPDLAANYAPLTGGAFTAHGGFRQPLDPYANMTASQRSVMDGVFEQFAARRYGLAYKSAYKLAHEAKQVLPGARWIAGLSAWHLGNIANAERDFSAIAGWAREQGEHDWTAQASYWAYRAALRQGHKETAARDLAAAAREEDTFYGLLAGAALKKSFAFAALRPDMPAEGIRQPVLDLMATAARLNDVGRTGDAESLLRHSFARLQPVEQQAIVWTAAELKLASLQLPMASRLQSPEIGNRYPLPEWTDRLSLDHALVLAIVRRESGFDPSAGSAAGAQGLMQIMPATADYVIRQQNALGVQTADSSNKGYLAVAKYRSFGLKNVDVNLAVGQAYLRYLTARPETQGSLIRVLASYNAGPAVLQGWNPQRDNNDPLLFIESIPLRETRDYVRNVLTDYWIYGTMLGNRSASLAELSENRWPALAL